MFVHWFQFQFQLVKGPFVLRGGRLEVSRAKSCPRNVSLATGPGLKRFHLPKANADGTALKGCCLGLQFEN